MLPYSFLPNMAAEQLRIAAEKVTVETELSDKKLFLYIKCKLFYHKRMVTTYNSYNRNILLRPKK